MINLERYINHMNLACRVQRWYFTAPDVNIKHRELCPSDYIGQELILKRSWHIQFNIYWKQTKIWVTMTHIDIVTDGWYTTVTNINIVTDGWSTTVTNSSIVTDAWCITMTNINIVTDRWGTTVTNINIVTGGWCTTVLFLCISN